MPRCPWFVDWVGRGSRKFYGKREISMKRRKGRCRIGWTGGEGEMGNGKRAEEAGVVELGAERNAWDEAWRETGYLDVS
eukprot:scaffold7624_cov248-Pinguiococcus_pyrenoidosus.AAC.11